jgi:hypothetical protein
MPVFRVMGAITGQKLWQVDLTWNARGVMGLRSGRRGRARIVPPGNLYCMSIRLTAIGTQTSLVVVLKKIKLATNKSNVMRLTYARAIEFKAHRTVFCASSIAFSFPDFVAITSRTVCITELCFISPLTRNRPL